MSRCLRFTAAVCLLALPALSAAQTYQITLAKGAKGDRTAVVMNEQTDSKVAIKDAAGKALFEKADKAGESARYTEEVLEKVGDKPATRLRRAYEKARQTQDGKTTTLPYEGKTVLIEKKGDRFVFTVEGGQEITGDDAQLLAKEFNKKKDDDRDLDALMMPTKPVAVNDTWKVDAAVFGKDLEKDGEMTVDVAKATATGKLLRAYKKDGRQFGVIEVKMEFPLKTVGKGDMKFAMRPGAALNATFLMDVCIDGGSKSGTGKMDFVMKGTGLFKAEGQELTVEMDVRSSLEGSGESLKK